MGRRITRKQLKQDDEFVTIADTVFKWFNENWRPFVFGAAALLAIYLVWGFASWWSENRSNKAAVDLAEAIEALDETGQGEEPQTGQEEGDEAPATNPEEELQQVIERHGGTVQGDVARLYLARMHLEQGREDEARELLVRLSERHRGNTLGRLATYDLIHLRIASGQEDEVATELQAMVKGHDNRLPRDLALWELGLLHAKQHKVDDAKEYLQTLTTEFPESPYRMAASRKLTELG